MKLKGAHTSVTEHVNNIHACLAYISRFLTAYGVITHFATNLLTKVLLREKCINSTFKMGKGIFDL